MKKTNSYSGAFGKLYNKIPKAVFAAVAFSFTSSGGDDWDHGIDRFLEEWRILHENGLVSQKPIARATSEKKQCPGCISAYHMHDDSCRFSANH